MIGLFRVGISGGSGKLAKEKDSSVFSAVTCPLVLPLTWYSYNYYSVFKWLKRDTHCHGQVYRCFKHSAELREYWRLEKRKQRAQAKKKEHIANG